MAQVDLPKLEDETDAIVLRSVDTNLNIERARKIPDGREFLSDLP
jgi:hypothetical protein